MTPICSKLIFRRLLIRLTTECSVKFYSSFFKQVHGCTMGGPLSVTFSDIYLVKMENNVVISSEPIFHRRFADDIYSRLKLGDNVLFTRLKKYHPNIKFTIEISPIKFLDTKLININGACKFKFIGKTQNYLHHGSQNSTTL